MSIDKKKLVMDKKNLQNELLALLREQFNLRMQHATKQLTKTSSLKIVRQKIARVKTILNQVTTHHE